MTVARGWLPRLSIGDIQLGSPVFVGSPVFGCLMRGSEDWAGAPQEDLEGGATMMLRPLLKPHRDGHYCHLPASGT